MVAISNITENLKAFPTTHNVLSTFLRRSILRRNLLACHRSVLGFLMADRWQLVMQSEKKIRQCRSAGELDTPDMHSCRQSCFSALTEIHTMLWPCSQTNPLESTQASTLRSTPSGYHRQKPTSNFQPFMNMIYIILFTTLFS